MSKQLLFSSRYTTFGARARQVACSIGVRAGTLLLISMAVASPADAQQGHHSQHVHAQPSEQHAQLSEQHIQPSEQHLQPSEQHAQHTPDTLRTMHHGQHGSHAHHAQQGHSTAQDRSELEALFWQRLEESRQHFVQADVDFMSDMIVHHAQALIMSRLSPENGASAPVQRLSARIINAQQDEIALMQQWLRDRGQPVPIIHFAGLDMHVSMEMPGSSAHEEEHAHHGHHSTEASHTAHGSNDAQTGHSHHSHPNHHSTHNEHAAHSGHTHHTAQHDTVSQESSHGHGGHHGHHGHHGHNHDDMVGMLSQAQMEELAAARGSEFDRLFLTYMIEHHEGAVYMVNELFMADGAGTDLEAYRLAVDIYAEQVTEIAMMRGMLQRKGFPVPDPLPELIEQQEQLRRPAVSQHEHRH